MTNEDLDKIVWNAETSKCLRTNEVTLPLPVFDQLVAQIRDLQREVREWEHTDDYWTHLISRSGLKMCTCGDLHCRHEVMCFD